MSKVLKYIIAYTLWFVNLGLSAWLFFLSRTVLLAILALFSHQGSYQYTKTVDLVDRVFTVVLGLGWLVFSIFTEEKYRTGALKTDLFVRFARITGPLLLCVFVVDLVLFWFQGIGAYNLLRLLILAVELILGLVLVVYSKKIVRGYSN